MRNLVRLSIVVTLLQLLSAPGRAVSSAENIVVSTIPGFSSFSSAKPDTYRLGPQGSFEGWFYAPFEVGDMASRDHEILVGHDDSGTIARLSYDGGLLGLINTPANRIGGVAVASNGDLFVADDSNNQLFRLDSAGQFLDLVFLPQAVNAIGVDAQDNVVFSVLHDPTSFNSPLDIAFFDFDLGAVTNTVTTQFRSISGLDISADGEILLLGSTSSFSSSSKISRLGMNGQLLGEILGPTGMSSVALVAVPEPGTALLFGFGLAAFAVRRRRPRWDTWNGSPLDPERR